MFAKQRERILPGVGVSPTSKASAPWRTERDSEYPKGYPESLLAKELADITIDADNLFEFVKMKLISVGGA